MSQEFNETEVKPAPVKPIRHLLNAIERSRKTSEPSSPSSTSLESMKAREEKLPEITMSEEFKNLLAVHEAGHAVVGITSQGILPIKTLVGPLSWHRGGPRVVFPTTEFQTKSHLLSVIETLLAGLVAEELVFGKGHTSLGVERDVHHATVLAAQMITMNAMGDHIGCSVPAIDQPLNIHALREDDDRLKEKWLSDAKDRAAETLKKQWPLFTAITQSLLTNERLTAKDMKALVSRHYLGSPEEIAQITEGSVPSTLKNHSTAGFKKAFLRKPSRIKKAS
jgi:ATP-dependent metalloprotease